jgi:hypothetical protein
MHNAVLKEGYISIVISFIIFCLLYLIDFTFLSIVLFSLTAFLIFLYRNSNFNKETKSSEIYSIASGLITQIETKNDYHHITIQKSFLDSSILTASLKSKIQNIRHIKGMNIIGSSVLAKKLRSSLSFELLFDKRKIFIEIIHICKEPTLNCQNSDNVEPLEKIGVLVYGEILMKIPKEYMLKIELGNRVKQTTIIGEKTDEKNRI